MGGFAGPDDPEDDEWHDSGVREVRWAALRRAAGTLVPDFPSEPEPSRAAAPAGAPAEAPARLKGWRDPYGWCRGWTWT